jgi:membrane protease YdiL (CAAX protease family)
VRRRVRATAHRNPARRTPSWDATIRAGAAAGRSSSAVTAPDGAALTPTLQQGWWISDDRRFYWDGAQWRPLHLSVQEIDQDDGDDLVSRGAFLAPVLRGWPRRNPMLFACGSLVIFLLIFEPASLLLPTLHLRQPFSALLSLAFVVLEASLPLVAIVGMGWSRAGGLTLWHRWRAPFLFLWLLPFVLLSMAAVASPDRSTGSVAQMGAFAALALLIGTAEEGFFRGLILESLLPLGRRAAIAVQGLFFGLFHLTNLGVLNPAYVALQIGLGLGLGWFFGALRLRTRALWLVIAMHAMFDWNAFIVKGPRVGMAAPDAAAWAVDAVFGSLGLFAIFFIARPGAFRRTVLVPMAVDPDAPPAALG